MGLVCWIKELKRVESVFKLSNVETKMSLESSRFKGVYTTPFQLPQKQHRIQNTKRRLSNCHYTIIMKDNFL